MSGMATADPVSVNALGDDEFDLIDVRTPVEFRECHAASARNVPLDELDPRRIMEQCQAQKQKLFVICKSGARGAKACQKFADAGIVDVVNVTGGTEAWVQAGLPVVRGQKAISLERQVRIVAGSLVLVFSILAIGMNPLFAIGSGFIGAGLAFAGVTDTCGMGMLLARMPWNKVA